MTDSDMAEVKRMAEQYGKKVVGEIKPLLLAREDGRRAWECMMDDGTREITVELCEAVEASHFGDAYENIGKSVKSATPALDRAEVILAKIEHGLADLKRIVGFE